MTADEIIAALRAERQRRRWTQNHVAELIGTSQSQLANWENRRVTPVATTLCHWANTLGLPLTVGGGTS